MTDDKFVDRLFKAISDIPSRIDQSFRSLSSSFTGLSGESERESEASRMEGGDGDDWEPYSEMQANPMAGMELPEAPDIMQTDAEVMKAVEPSRKEEYEMEVEDRKERVRNRRRKDGLRSDFPERDEELETELKRQKGRDMAGRDVAANDLELRAEGSDYNMLMWEAQVDFNKRVAADMAGLYRRQEWITQAYERSITALTDTNV